MRNYFQFSSSFTFCILLYIYVRTLFCVNKYIVPKTKEGKNGCIQCVTIRSHIHYITDICFNSISRVLAVGCNWKYKTADIPLAFSIRFQFHLVTLTGVGIRGIPKMIITFRLLPFGTIFHLMNIFLFTS